MTSGGRRKTVAVLDCDPDLGEGLTEAELVRARARAHAVSHCYPRGRWQVPFDPEPTPNLGLLIVRGFVVREVTVAGYTCGELLGPGDVLQSLPHPGPDASVRVQIKWGVVQPMTLAVLDRTFVERVSAWPEITIALARRLTWRTDWLSFQLALAALRRIEDRVILMLWQFADRWGTVTPDGVVIDVPLTHELLASVVGARRPSISAAVRRLVDRDQIRPRPRFRWLLLGAPPREG